MTEPQSDEANDGLYFGPCLNPAGDPPHGAQLTGDQLASALDKLWGKDYTRHGTRDAEKWFPKQARGSAPEPPPDGFLIPPGFAEGLRATVAELFGIPDEMRRDLEHLPPPARRTRLRWRLADLRESTARHAFRAIAGYWPHDGEDDWS